MNYNDPQVSKAAELLKEEFNDLQRKADILKAPELRELYEKIKTLPSEQRASFGQDVNNLRTELQEMVDGTNFEDEKPTPIDVTAPYDINQKTKPHLLSADQGSIHPLTRELNVVLDIFYRMGFSAIESRQIDDDFHMFEALNFPAGHPARDDYDTFTTTDGLIAPAHTSTMQNRALQKYKHLLDQDRSIAVVIPGRVYRNEDLDARHEHTFWQLEGVYVGKNINAGNLIATLKTFLQEYYNQDLEIKTQPSYFPFTEPSFEFSLSCPFCKKAGCAICSQSGWIELIGCGMIHPNVLDKAGIDHEKYTGFAWGLGINRLVMMKYDIDDIRYFLSGRLDFLRQFK